MLKVVKEKKALPESRLAFRCVLLDNKIVFKGRMKKRLFVLLFFNQKI